MAEPFRELLNRPTRDSPTEIQSAETELPISCDNPSKVEIKRAIMTLKSGKAAGPAEAIKAGIACLLYRSLQQDLGERRYRPSEKKEPSSSCKKKKKKERERL